VLRPPKLRVRFAIALVCLYIWSASAQENSQRSTGSTRDSKPSPNTIQQAQSSAQPAAQSVEVLRVTSRMVLVDAVVTDSSGKPVAGLKPDDFRVFENGKPQTIRAFGARTPELLARQASQISPAHSLPPGLFTNITDFHPEYGPLTIILIDSLNTSMLDQAYMRDALIKYLQNMGPRQNVAIFTLGTHLGLVQNVDADPQVLQEALKRVASDPSLKKKKPPAPSDDSTDAKARALAADLLGVGEAQNRERQIGMMQDSVLEFFPDQALVQTGMKVQLTLQALQKIARNVAGYPGRKNLIWLSAAFPLSVDPITVGAAEARNYAPEVQETANLLTNNEVAVYPVDARGLVGNFLPDASFHGGLRGPAAAGGISTRSLALGASHTTMDHLAEQTGGRAYYNRNDIDHGIAISVQDGSIYYSLGYYPTDKNWDGKFRKIELHVLGKGLHARYRHGYYANDTGHLTPEQGATGRKEFLSALAMDAPSATLLPVVAHVIAPDKQHPQVFVDIGVDPHSVIFDPQPNNRQEGKLEFATIVIDANGKPLTSKSDILNTELTPETFARVMNGTLVMRHKFDLPAGNYLLRVGVRDMKSNAFGTLIAKVQIAASN
jgi:VWFA-related protein